MDIPIMESLLKDYGIFGGALIVIIYITKSNNNKLDKLLSISNKLFGLSLGLIDKDSREEFLKKEDKTYD